MNKFSKLSKLKLKQNKSLDMFIYFILIATIAMISPLIYKIADTRVNSAPDIANENVSENARITKNKKYIVNEFQADILASLKETQYGALNYISSKILNDGRVILFCESKSESDEKAGSALRIAVLSINQDSEEFEESQELSETQKSKDTRESRELKKLESSENLENLENLEEENEIENERKIENEREEEERVESLEFYRYVQFGGMCESIKSNNYIYKDYGDGTVFLSNSKTAFLFSTDEMRIKINYELPQDYKIYQAVLSNDKTRLAIAAQEGFFICSVEAGSPLKELIASVTANNIRTTAREPFWSQSDEYIFYKSYSGETLKGAGLTTCSPGGNERFTGLTGLENSANFLFLKNDTIFYYFLGDGEFSQNQENLFRCGYFYALGDKKMNDIMKSQLYYFDVKVSANGNHLAALYKNGSMTKINIIDIHTKKLIYSAIYDRVYDCSFSSDEKNFLIYCRIGNESLLRSVEINWTEE